MAVTNHLVEELLKQPREVREAAVEALLDSLENDDVAGDGGEFHPSVEKAWHDEIARRIEDNEPTIPAETVFAELEAELARHRR